ncbi:MAG TPA: hypothetical protein VFL69_08670 [Marmoricola sp.]|nr:hypothetical protein [Marmoricola sp.]
MLTDEEIARLTPAERRDLILRLGRPLEELGVTPGELRQGRRLRLALLAVCVVVLVPWIGYLAVTLPERHQVRTWDLTWVGFDLILLTLLALSLLLGWRRRLLVVPMVGATGTLLVCDAWFDVTTAAPGSELLWSALSAVVVELPLAVVLLTWSGRVLRLLALRLWLAEPEDHLWQVVLPSGRRSVRRARAGSPRSRSAPSARP